MRKILIFALLFMTWQLQAKSLTVVKGIISNPQGNTLDLTFYSDLISFKTVRLPVPVNASGTFNIPLYLDAPKTLIINYGDRTEQIYIEPGNRLEMFFDGLDTETPALYLGDGAIHNDYLSKANHKLEKYTDTQINNQIQSLTSDQFKVWIDEMRIKKQMIYDAYPYKAAFSNQFNSYVRSEIDHWWALQLVNYAKSRIHLEQDASAFFTFLNGLTIQDDEALCNANYVKFIQEYTNIQNRLTRIWRDKDYYFSGKSLAYLKGVRLHQLIGNKQHNSYQSDIARFVSECEYSEYRDVIEEAYASAGQLHSGEYAPEAQLLDVDNYITRLSHFRGKVVYLDFWASWCVTCIHEMEYSKRLDEKFDDDEVVFLYVSLDEKRERWVRWLNGKHIDRSRYLYARGGFDSDIAKAYGIQALPAYFLIDQNGKIVQSPAQRPTKAQAAEDIEALLMNYR